MKRKVVTDPKSPLFDFDDFNKSCNSKTAYTTPYQAQYAIDLIESCNHNLKMTFYSSHTKKRQPSSEVAMNWHEKS